MTFPRRYWIKTRRLLKRLARWHAAIPPAPPTLVLLSTAGVVGLVAGLGGILFRELTDRLAHFTFPLGQPSLAWLGLSAVIIMPTLGGALIGLLLYRRGQERIGLGLDEVIEAVARWGGRLRLLRMLNQVAAAAICMGTGGSVGREEPIAQLGSGLGSAIGQRLRLSEESLRYLVASGAAGGIAVALHAPIAAVFFALEVILAEYSVAAVGSIALASVSACAIANLMGYQAPMTPAPAFALISSWELPLYAVLGGLAAMMSLAFAIIFCWVDIWFAALEYPADMKPVIGGLFIGVLGFHFPQALGMGYNTLTEVLQSQVPLDLMIILIGIKMLTTSITLASGGMGGVLAPSLLIGAFLGGSFGSVAHHLWPAFTAASSAYALVGMAAVLATILDAPLTAVLFVFEFTGDARILMPLLLTTSTSICCARYLRRAPLDTVALWWHHIHWRANSASEPIPRLQVAQVMRTHVATVPTTMELSELARAFDRLGLQAVLVTDPHGAFHGLLSLAAFKRALICEATHASIVGDIASTTVATVYPDEFISAAVDRMASGDLWCLPVVDRSRPPRLLGVVYREDLNRVCQRDGMRGGHHAQNR